MMSMFIFTLAMPHPTLDDGVHAPPVTRSLDQKTVTNGQRIARGLPPAAPKRLYDRSEHLYSVKEGTVLMTDAPRLQPRVSG